MQTNVRPCPHCNGTGEVRTAWFAVTRYQDGSDRYGPYGSEAEARAAHPEPDGYGCRTDFEEHEIH